jgi:hypothetical protein
MAITQIGICNSALTLLGCDLISSITQETKSARLLNGIWDLSRDEVIRAHRWNFATKRAVLAPTATAPDFEWDYAFDIPNDCLRILEPDSNDLQFVVENGQILCDEDSLNFKYVYRNEDESSWDASFARAMALYLAKEICYAMTQSLALTESIEKRYMMALAEAKFNDGSEGTMPDLESFSWTDVRR